MAKKLKAMFDNTVGNVVKNKEQINAEMNIAAVKNRVANVQAIGRSMRSGKPMQGRSLTLKRDIEAFQSAAAGGPSVKRGKKGKLRGGN